MFKKYFFVIYYFLLMVVLQTQQSEVMPSMAIRLAFIGAVIWPLYSVKKEMMPVVMCLFYNITNYNFSYSYMPYEVYQYNILIALGLVIGYRKKFPIKVRIPFFLIAWLILVTIVDLVTDFKVFMISHSIMGVMLLWPYLKFGDVNQLRLMSWAFILTGFVLSLNFLVFGQQYLDAYEGGDDLERQGWTDPNYFGCAVGFGVVAALVEILQGKNNLVLKIVLIISVFVMLICLSMNASRGALLAAGLSSIILIFLTKVKPVYKVLAAFLLFCTFVILDYLEVFELLKFRLEHDDNGGSGRTTIWANKLTVFFEEANPLHYLCGMGQEGGRALAMNTGISPGFHNDFLAFFCEYGLVGLTLFIKWLYYPIQVAKTNKWLIVSVVGYIAICGLTLEPVTAGRFTYFAFWIYALQLARVQKRRKKTVFKRYKKKISKIKRRRKIIPQSPDTQDNQSPDVGIVNTVSKVMLVPNRPV